MLISGGDVVVGAFIRIKNFYLWLASLSLIYLSACAPPPGTTGSSDASTGSPLAMSGGEFLFSSVYFALVAFFVYYMLVLQPERLKKDSHEKFVGDLKKGDEVMTSGGLVGRVVSVKDGIVTIESGANTKLNISTAYIHPLMTKTNEEKGAKKDSKAEPRESGAKKKKANRG